MPREQGTPEACLFLHVPQAVDVSGMSGCLEMEGQSKCSDKGAGCLGVPQKLKCHSGQARVWEPSLRELAGAWLCNAFSFLRVPRLRVGTETGSPAVPRRPLDLTSPRKPSSEPSPAPTLPLRVGFGISCSSFWHRAAKNQISARWQ